MTKTCISCSTIKDIGEFYKRSDSPDGYRNDCKECNDESRTVRYVADGKVKTNHYKRYNVSKEEFIELRDARDQAQCAICRGTDRMVIDHCHNTGKIRGFLCSNCNTGIGLMEDDIVRLESAINYLLTARYEDETGN